MRYQAITSRVSRLVLIALSIFSANVNAAIVAHWTFDEAGGAIAADSVGGFDGTLAGSAAFVGGGVSGNAIDFDQATGDLVNMGNVLGFGGALSFTVSTWINTTSMAIIQLIVTKHHAGFANGWVLAFNTGSGYGQPNKAYFYDTDLPGQEAISTSSVNDGEWHHVVGVFDSALGTQAIYVDGALETTIASGNVTTGNGAEFIVGGVSTLAPVAAFTGQVDDVQIYDMALTVMDIERLFDNPGRNLQNIPLPPAILFLASGLLGLMIKCSRR